MRKFQEETNKSVCVQIYVKIYQQVVISTKHENLILNLSLKMDENPSVIQYKDTHIGVIGVDIKSSSINIICISLF